MSNWSIRSNYWYPDSLKSKFSAETVYPVYYWISSSFMNCSFLIELYQAFTVPLSKATTREPIGSKTENSTDVTAFRYLAKASTFPTVIFGFP